MEPVSNLITREDLRKKLIERMEQISSKCVNKDTSVDETNYERGKYAALKQLLLDYKL